MLDGMVALASGKASWRGEILNDLPDRVSDVIIFVGVAHSGLMHPVARLLGGDLCARDRIRRHVRAGGRRAARVQRPDVEAVAHGRAACRRVADTRALSPTATIRSARLTILDWTCLVVIAGCVQTIAVRFQRIMRALAREGCCASLMSPRQALNDPIFLAYVRVVAVTLAGAGAILALLQFVLKKQLGAIWQTYRGWLVMAPLALAVIFAGRVPFIIGVTLLAIFGIKEFARASGLVSRLVDDRRGLRRASSPSASPQPLPQPQGEEPGTGWYGFFVAVPVFAIALILLIPILRNRTRGELQRMSLGIVGFVYVGWMFGHLGFMANAVNAYGYLCFIIFATEVNDVAAFTFGRIFGRHPLRSEISPRKTWEGALGALAVSMILPWLLRFSLPEFGPTQLILTGLIVGIGGQLGDLSISVIKRDIGTKDMGASIPGHGGILDRIDSLIYVAPLFMHMAGYYYPLR